MKIFKARRAEADRESMERLEQAEKDLGQLQQRAYHAQATLDSRHGRNHWRESIQQLILGAH